MIEGYTARSAGTFTSTVRRWTRVGVMSLALGSALVWTAALAPGDDGASATAPVAADGFVPIQLPIRDCPTSYGVAGVTPAKLPKSARALVPLGIATKMSVFSDGLGLLRLVAPATWDCHATVDADGSSSLTIVAPGTTARFGSLSSRSQIEEINGYQSGGCVGCAVALACPLSANARALAQGLACPVKVRREEVLSISKGVVEFVDPPGVRGDANPSGGANPSYGVVTFRAGPATWSRLVTCVMRPVEREVCAAVVRNFTGAVRPG